ncbi:urea transporter [Candidatus Woesearchaeota archaeon]|nr:urea transporter [Candidatus Woesearchaeota archaeon]
MISEILKITLRGFSQVMLQNSALTGILFLSGILYNSPVMAAAGLLGCAASTAAAWLLKYPKKDISEGLYGFNGVLVGVALAYFFKFTPILAALIIIGAAASATAMNLLKRKLLPYTFPFVLVTWMLYFLISSGNLVPKNSLLVANASPILANAALMGFGQVMFQASIVTGALFLIGITANSVRAAAFATVGSFGAALIAMALLQDSAGINAGLFGFNAVLCALAFEKKGTVFALIAAALSVPITIAMIGLPVPVLTFPFVAATWITLLLSTALSANFKNRAKS